MAMGLLDFKRSKKKIDDVVFYTESLRIIEYYLKVFSYGTPVETLNYFVNHMCIPTAVKRSDRLVGKIPGTGGVGDFQKDWHEDISSAESFTTMQDLLKKYPHLKYRQDAIETRKLFFIEEIRLLLLNTLLKKNAKGRSLLKTYHLYTHLIELSFKKEYTFFEKVNEFLNTNFKLLGELIRIQPELTAAIEEFYIILKGSRDENSKNSFPIQKTDINSEIVQSELRSQGNEYLLCLSP